MGGTKRQREEYEQFLTNEMNTDTLAYILTLALEATQLELKKVRKELEDLQAKKIRQRSLFAINADIERSRERINRILRPGRF